MFRRTIRIRNDPDALIVVSTAEERYFIGWDYNISWSPPRQTQQQYEPLPNKDQMRELLKRRQDLNIGECRKFLKGVLKNLKIPEKLGIEGSFEALFDYMIGEKKVGLIRVEGLGSSGVSHHGSKAPHPTGFQALPAAQNDADKYKLQMRFVGTLIHELIHRATGDAGHKKMARAGFAALSSEEQKAFKSSGDNSEDFSRMVNQKCKFNIYDPQEVKANVIKN